MENEQINLLANNDFQQSKTFKISIAISLLLHVVFLLYFYYNQSSSTSFINDNKTKNPSPKIRTYILKKPAQKKEYEIKPIQEELELISVASKSDLRKINSVQVKPTVKSTPKSTTINFARLSASISNVVQQDSQRYQQQIFDDCESIKKKTGAIDCVSNLQRLGFQKQDPFNLAKIFKTLDKNPKGKQKQRILAALAFEETQLIKMLDNKILPADIRELFNDEIAYIRGERHYQDCDGKPNSGTCGGEIDLNKIGDLVMLLIGE